MSSQRVRARLQIHALSGEIIVHTIQPSDVDGRPFRQLWHEGWRLLIYGEQWVLLEKSGDDGSSSSISCVDFSI